MDMARACLEHQMDEQASSVLMTVVNDSGSGVSPEQAMGVFARAGRTDLVDGMGQQLRAQAQILLGVADDGTLLGLEVDGFENDDKCRLHFKNLLNQHLGPEYARLVRFELYLLEGKRLGAVECERSSTPVFLRAKNNEEAFLIRTGPSNIELSLSRALKYIQERG